MKSTLISRLRFLMLSVLLAIPAAAALAQDAKIDVDVTKSSSSWTAGPWVWIIGAAVFILILAAILTSRGKSRD